MTTQDPQTLLQKLTEAQQAHGFDVLTFALGILQKILQPLIGSRSSCYTLIAEKSGRIATPQSGATHVTSIGA